MSEETVQKNENDRGGIRTRNQRLKRLTIGVNPMFANQEKTIV